LPRITRYLIIGRRFDSINHQSLSQWQWFYLVKKHDVIHFDPKYNL
jgi:hypothetical protein